jgi:uncharacterized protein
MAHPNEDLVRRGYEAFGKGDMDTLATLMTDDVAHTIPGNNPIAGEHKGRDAVFAMYGQIGELSGGTYRADVESVEAKGDNTVVSTHHGTGERAGKTLDVRETLTFTIESGKITKIESSFTPDDEAAEDAFWS